MKGQNENILKDKISEAHKINSDNIDKFYIGEVIESLMKEFFPQQSKIQYDNDDGSVSLQVGKKRFLIEIKDV